MTGFPVSLISFPLNLIVMLVWAGLAVGMWKGFRKSAPVRFLLSPAATFSAILLLLASCLYMGVTGRREFASSWAFVLILLYFQTVLLFVLMRGWHQRNPSGRGKVRWRFVLLHAGLLFAVGSAFWGAPDTETLRLQAVRSLPVREAYHMDGQTEWLEYEIELKEFDVSVGDDGVPSDYEAFMAVDGKDVSVRVNHPYSRRLGEDIYLAGYDAYGDDYICIVQIVREPWKYGTLAGIVMMLAGACMLFVRGPVRRHSEK